MCIRCRRSFANVYALLRLAAQSALLEAEALAEMGGGDGASSRIALAVNADSMATWFVGVFDALDSVLFDIRIEDQDHSVRLLREGVVMGAVTIERSPVSGCRVQALGVMMHCRTWSCARCFVETLQDSRTSSRRRIASDRPCGRSGVGHVSG